MPIYRYRCTQCEAHEEHLQKISDPPIEICASCGGPLSKQMTAAAFHLKGGGWYKDLYASSKTADSTPAAATPSPAKSDSASAGSTPSASPSTPSTPSTPSSSGSSSGGGTSSSGSSSTTAV